jgi:glycosyltransferase involved in cell wall biosynthesis
MVVMLNKSYDERRSLGIAARKRVEDNFSLNNVVGTYAALYDELIPGDKN